FGEATCGVGSPIDLGRLQIASDDYEKQGRKKAKRFHPLRGRDYFRIVSNCSPQRRPGACRLALCDHTLAAVRSRVMPSPHVSACDMRHWPTGAPASAALR